MAKLIKIYGERNTNTNYLSELIRLNINIDQMPGVVPVSIKRRQEKWFGDEWLRDLYFMVSYSRNLGWKHAAVNWSRLSKSTAYINNDVTVVTLTKNPYAWLLSLYKRPYHQYYSKKPTFTEFLSSPWKTTWREGVSRWVENPVQLWNIKNNSYLCANASVKVLNLRAEDTLSDPRGVINRISRSVSVPCVDGFSNVLKSTKDGSKDFRYYHDYYLREIWRSEWAVNDIKFVNKIVDKSLMELYGYTVIE